MPKGVNGLKAPLNSAPVMNQMGRVPCVLSRKRSVHVSTLDGEDQLVRQGSTGMSQKQSWNREGNQTGGNLNANMLSVSFDFGLSYPTSF